MENRKIDKLGRILLPESMRKNLFLGENSVCSIHVENQQIIIEKYKNECYACGRTEDLMQFRGIYICKDCINQIKSGEHTLENV